ncbi:MAG: hypothetical protein F6K35_29330 [Okeania sp. SIO2H7]|nr:hypothetical protein [Okeania sp. SIO2H7]
MNHAEIKERIRQNMTDANLKIDELRVQPDPYRGWRIAVISPGFERKYPYERKDIAFQGLEEVIIEWSNLLTPGNENQWGIFPLIRLWKIFLRGRNL